MAHDPRMVEIAELPEPVQRAIREDRRIEAIILLREAQDLSYEEAAAIVDSVADRQRAAYGSGPPKFETGIERLALIAAVLIALAVLAWFYG